MKTLTKMLVKRLSSKNPNFFKVLQWIAGILLAIFFGADAVFDLCELVPWLCKFETIIYTLLATIIGMGQLAVSSDSKNIKDVS